MNEPTFDSDGYPTDETLEAIEKWPIRNFTDVNELLVFIRKAWRYPDYWTTDKRRSREWKNAPLRRLHHVSTGGWSGNESLIYAAERNFLFWGLAWVQQRRGGHYIFEVRDQ